MAKGDAGQVKSASGTGVPKQDQYSVMHAIMDNIGGGGAIAPSVMPGRDMKTPADFTNVNFNELPNNRFGQTYPEQPMGGRMNGGIGMPRMGSMNGVTGGQGIAPTNPQDIMRRTMMSKGVYGQ